MLIFRSALLFFRALRFLQSFPFIVAYKRSLYVSIAKLHYATRPKCPESLETTRIYTATT